MESTAVAEAGEREMMDSDAAKGDVPGRQFLILISLAKDLVLRA